MPCEQKYKNKETIDFCKEEDRLFKTANQQINNFESSFSDYVKNIHKKPLQKERHKRKYNNAERGLNNHLNAMKNLKNTIQARIKSRRKAMTNNDTKFNELDNQIKKKKNEYKSDYHSFDASTTLKKDMHKSKRYNFFNLGYYSIGSGLLIYFLYKQIKN
tara:strand:- start:280 stop:759 length:480 start_codon:yes stop_codon:yes gene_type:complete